MWCARFERVEMWCARFARVKMWCARFARCTRQERAFCVVNKQLPLASRKDQVSCGTISKKIKFRVGVLQQPCDGVAHRAIECKTNRALFGKYNFLQTNKALFGKWKHQGTRHKRTTIYCVPQCSSVWISGFRVGTSYLSIHDRLGQTRTHFAWGIFLLILRYVWI